MKSQQRFGSQLAGAKHGGSHPNCAWAGARYPKSARTLITGCTRRPCGCYQTTHSLRNPTHHQWVAASTDCERAFAILPYHAIFINQRQPQDPFKRHVHLRNDRPWTTLTPMPRSLNSGSRNLNYNHVLVSLPGQQQEWTRQISSVPRPQTISLRRWIPSKS